MKNIEEDKNVERDRNQDKEPENLSQLFVMILLFVVIFGTGPLLGMVYAPLGIVFAIIIYWLNLFISKAFTGWNVTDDELDGHRATIFSFTAFFLFFVPPLSLYVIFDDTIAGMFGLPIGMFLVYVLLELNERFSWVKDTGLLKFIRSWFEIIKKLLSLK